ncbi:MAG: glycosyltransferase, partial [Campylobacterota bacterium]|nr:glycosyltransferase [Campylobacterota bacterium]
LDLELTTNYDVKKIDNFLSSDMKHYNLSLDELSIDVPDIIRKILLFRDKFNHQSSYKKFDNYTKEIFTYKTLFYNEPLEKELSKDLSKKDKHIANQEEIISSHLLHVKDLEDVVEAKEQIIADKDHHIANQEEIIDSHLLHVKDLEDVVEAKEQIIADKDHHIANQEEIINAHLLHIDELAKNLFYTRELARSLTLKNRFKNLFGLYHHAKLCKHELPYNFSKYFDEKKYLTFHQDIAKAVSERSFNSGFEHFCISGYDEVYKGTRKLYDSLDFYDDADYQKKRIDVTEAIESGNFLYSHFIHYLMYGHKEILKETKKSKNILLKDKLKNGIKDPKKIKDALLILNNEGMKGLKARLSDQNANEIYTYKEPELTEEISLTLKNFKKKPLISIIMPVYNVDPKWLDLAIKSIQKQWYSNWELCIVDDKSSKKKTINYLKNIKNSKIKMKFLEKNLNISGASNEALALSTGSYIALMDNDDELTADALYEVVKAINDNNAEFIYSDEDKIEMNSSFSEPHFKPDFSPDMFLSQNYISHLGVIKKELISKVKGFTLGLEGAQDYDLYL